MSTIQEPLYPRLDEFGTSSRTPPTIEYPLFSVDESQSIPTVEEQYEDLSPEEEMDSEHPNLVAVEQAVNDYEGDPEDVEALNSKLATEPFATLLKRQKKWVEAGFSEDALKGDPEAVKFAVESKIIHIIAMLNDAGDALLDNEPGIDVDNGRVYFKVEGQWKLYDEIKEDIVYNPQEGRIVGWNFVHPDGFVKGDQLEFDELRPIAQITPEVYAALKEKADQFWSSEHPEVDVGRDKGFIFQLTTTKRDQMPDTWWGKNINEWYPEHTTFRIIAPNGDIYSFGTRLRAAVENIANSPYNNMLTTTNSKFSQPDYEDPRDGAKEKRTTCIPMTCERFENMMAFIRDQNRGDGFRFSFTRQNCTRIATALLQITGVSGIDTRVAPAEFIYNILPNLSDIPFIGKPLSIVVKVISAIVSPIFAVLSTIASYIIPKCIRNFVWTVLTFIPYRLATFMVNLLGIYLGALKTHPRDPSDPRNREDTIENEARLTSFEQVFKWYNLFDPYPLTVYHSTKLRYWQDKQNNTMLYKNPKNGFCITPAIES